jgi:hypothetical protein
MPMTRSELMYFTAGVAVGSMVGANWSKVKPILEQVLGPAAEGFGAAYSDISRAVAERYESAQDMAADRRHKSNGKKKKKKKDSKRKESAAEPAFDLSRFMSG